MISVVFFDYSNASTRTCASSSFAARLFHNAVAAQARIPLCIKEAPPCLCAADAFAKGETAGLGGWFLLPGLPCVVQNISSFQLEVTTNTLPSWLRPAKRDPLQSIIASLEALAQLILLVLRRRELALPRGEYFILRLLQLCDNAGVVSASSKMLSMKEPLCWILQAVGLWSILFRASRCSQLLGGCPEPRRASRSFCCATAFCGHVRASVCPLVRQLSLHPSVGVDVATCAAAFQSGVRRLFWSKSGPAAPSSIGKDW